MHHRLGKQSTCQSSGLSVDMAGLALASTFVHCGHKAKVGVHLSQSFEPSDIRHISQKG